jgi:predicted nucleotidyltransferase
MKQIKFKPTNQVSSTSQNNVAVCARITKGLQAIKGVKAVLLCGSRAMNCNNKYSDYDFFVVNTWKNKYIQTIHSKFGSFGMDFILYPFSEFKKPNEASTRIIAHLLRKYSVLYADKEMKEVLKKEISTKLSKLANKYELESIWYWIWSSIDKARRYMNYDKQLANVVLSEAYYFIGLFYGRLCGKECQGYSHSLKYMRKKHFSYWKKYYEFTYKQKTIDDLIKLIQKLPNAENFFKKKSLVELNGFINTFPMYENRIVKEEGFKKKIDSLVSSLSKRPAV